MSNTAEHYLRQLQALLPLGDAWPREDDATLTQFLYGLAEEFARIDGRGEVLIDESDPRTTIEMLPDWERAFSLPDPCTQQVDTIQERHDVLHEKVTRIGGQSRQYFIDVAERLGFDITITEFSPFTVISDVNHPLYDTDWWFAWQVNAPEETVRCMTVLSGVEEPLCDWGNEILECVINRLKPAHTHVLFSYGA